MDFKRDISHLLKFILEKQSPRIPVFALFSNHFTVSERHPPPSALPEAAVVGMDPTQQPLLAASNPFVRRVAMVLYDLALGTLQKPSRRLLISHANAFLPMNC